MVKGRIILLNIVIICSIFSVMITITSSTVNAYSPSTPIIINSNDDFISQGWPGDGTLLDPWMIEGLEINGSGYKNCIYVGNTTDYFAIDDCYLHDINISSSPYYSNGAINFYRVENGSIKNSIISSNDHDGLYLYESNHSNIMGNEISDNGYYGIGFRYSNHNIFADNSVIGSENHGIMLSESSNNEIMNNTVKNNGFYGIQLQELSNKNQVSGNVVSNMNHPGINVWWSGLNNINNNTITNVTDGIHISDSVGNNIIHNTIMRNANGLNIRADGNLIYLNIISFNVNSLDLGYSTKNNIIYYNDIVDNDNPFIRSEGEDLFDNGYPIGGNYWSEYNGVDGFSGENQTIPGSDGLGDSGYYVDNYPLMHPVRSDWSDDIVPTSTLMFFDSYWFNAPINLHVIATDKGGSGVSNVTFLNRFSEDNVTWTDIIELGTVETPPWNWTFDFSDGVGFYEFYTYATDVASNIELMPSDTMIRSALDISPPLADTGRNRSIEAGSEHIFYCIDSGDNIGITNYSWTFMYNETEIILTGESPTFTFWTLGTYNITLNVTDAAGNWDMDTISLVVHKRGFHINPLLPILIIAIVAYLLIHYRVRHRRKPQN